MFVFSARASVEYSGVVSLSTSSGVLLSKCGGVRTEQLPWVTEKQRLAHAYRCFLAKWAEMLPWYSVAKLFSCVWGTVATAVKSVVRSGIEHRDLSGIPHIGIDEISQKKIQEPRKTHPLSWSSGLSCASRPRRDMGKLASLKQWKSPNRPILRCSAEQKGEL